jgi:hypothetical protein
MGGRRSYSIKEVLREDSDTRTKRASLTKALKGEDIDGISRGSANLIPDHKAIAKIFIFSEKLLDTVKDKYTPKDLKELKEINKKVRIDWAKLKKDLNIETIRIVDVGVVDAVSRALKERSK